VGFASLTEQIDTTTPGGTLIFHVFGALAEFERALIVERTQAGLAAARARGRMGGRPCGTTRQDPKKLALAQHLANEQQRSVTEICQTLGIARTTFYRYIGSNSEGNPRGAAGAARGEELLHDQAALSGIAR
jgi:DNA invertase Pin-like site-specific DNA recombinase